MKKLLIATAISSLFLAGAAQAAGTANATIAVSATVSGTCKITTAGSGMAFGTIDPSVVAANVTASATFGYKCTTGLTPVITDDLGLHEVGAQRKMSDGATNTLNYGVANVPPGTPAGNGFGAGSTERVYTVNGTILLADAQSAAAAVYADTITYTLTF